MQAAAQQPVKNTSRGEKTYYLCPNDENEQRIVMAWLEKNCPGYNTPGHPRFATELRIDRLTDEHCVRILARTGRRVTPALRTERNEHGESKVVRAEPEDLVGEVAESAPIECKTHWLRPSDGEEGELIVSGFLEALGKVCVPYAVKWKPDDGRKLRLGWA
jgi:hypothetical protein